MLVGLSFLLRWKDMFGVGLGFGMILGPAGILVALGFLRARIFHPALNERYRDWLSSTPWRPGSKLPFIGPGLEARDLCIVISGEVMSFLLLYVMEFPFYRFGVASALYLYAYIASSIYTLFVTRSPIAAAILYFLLFLSLPMIHVPWGLWFLVPTMLAVAHIGLLHSLKHFDWDYYQAESLFRKAIFSVVPFERGKVLFGYALGYPIRPPKIKYPLLVLFPILMLWPFFMYYCAIIWEKPELEISLREMRGIGGFAIVCLALGRIFCYSFGTTAPLSILGRILGMHWVIPSHDKKYLPSILGLAIYFYSFESGSVEVLMLRWLVSVWVVLLMPPSLESWILTGNYRSSELLIRSFVKQYQQPVQGGTVKSK